MTYFIKTNSVNTLGYVLASQTTLAILLLITGLSFILVIVALILRMLKKSQIAILIARCTIGIVFTCLTMMLISYTITQTAQGDANNALLDNHLLRIKYSQALDQPVQFVLVDNNLTYPHSFIKGYYLPKRHGFLFKPKSLSGELYLKANKYVKIHHVDIMQANCQIQNTYVLLQYIDHNQNKSVLFTKNSTRKLTPDETSKLLFNY